MIRKVQCLAWAVGLAAMGEAAIAQVPNPETMTPPSTQRAPETGDMSANPSTYDQINRATQNIAAENAARAVHGGKVKTRPATAAEIGLGNEVRDKKGKAVGTIQSVEADGAVVVTAAGKVKVPLEAFGMDGKGLVIAITKAEFDSLVASATGAPAG